MSWKEVDPLKVWSNSSIVPVDRNPGVEPNTDNLAIQPQSSSLFKSLREMRNEDQDRYLNTLISNWPFKWERRAFEFPLHATALSCGATGMFVGVKIAGEVFHPNVKLTFGETIRKTSKMITIPPCYINAITGFACWTFFVKHPIMRDPDFCSSCLFLRGLAVSFGCGVMLPAFSTPILAQAFALQQGAVKVDARNVLERVAMIYEYNRPLFRHFPKMFAIHLVSSSICVYSTLWGWNRIFQTMDVDPGFIREAVASEVDQAGYAVRFRNNIVDWVDRINAA